MVSCVVVALYVCLPKSCYVGVGDWVQSNSPNICMAALLCCIDTQSSACEPEASVNAC
jgi:hypothetical protein